MPLAVDKSGQLVLHERDVQKAVMDLLRYEGWHVVRVHVGTFRAMDGKRVIRSPKSMKGHPDLMALKAIVGYDGSKYPYPLTSTLFIETKRTKGGRLSADQIAWRDHLQAEGFEWLLGDSLETVRDYLRGGGRLKTGFEAEPAT